MNKRLPAGAGYKLSKLIFFCCLLPIIVNLAAYTAVDKAESNRDTAFAVNAKAPAVFAKEAERLGGVACSFCNGLCRG